MSHQYGNKSKSQLTSPTPAQLQAVAVSTGHIWLKYIVFKFATVKYIGAASFELATLFSQWPNNL
jgi:hypothetical protein